ncbi:hypothetical protein [Fulvimarina endophytica]|uniref:hypothetical protein n=1 Tax=Fulvimarina endophytica TaxID=2293836 RepID=UPI0011C03998|nr:hypothetical protein [Fulvimarina endophytica]
MARIVEEAAESEHRLEETRLKFRTNRVLSSLGDENELFAGFLRDDANEPDTGPGMVFPDGTFLADDLGAVSAFDKRSEGILDDDIWCSLEHHDLALSSFGSLDRTGSAWTRRGPATKYVLCRQGLVRVF